MTMNDATQQMVELIRRTRREEREREERKKRDVIEFRRQRLEKQQLERMLRKERARRMRHNRDRAHKRSRGGKPFYEKPGRIEQLVDDTPVELDAEPSKTICGSHGPVGSAIEGSNLIRDYCCVCGEPMRVAVLRGDVACLSCHPTGQPGAKHDTFEAKQITYHGSQHASGEW